MKSRMKLAILVVGILILGCIVAIILSSQESVNRIVYPDGVDFIVSVSPKPDSQLSLSLYRANLSRMDEQKQKGMILLNSYGIVVKIDMGEIDGRMEPGEYPPTIFARVTLFLDGKEIDKGLKTGTETFVVSSVRDEEGNIIAYEHYGEQGIGWKVIPSLGPHEAKIRVVDSKGKIYEYIWSFEVVP
jgi:hypothetical protein